jgi:hypothetical protein
MAETKIITRADLKDGTYQGVEMKPEELREEARKIRKRVELIISSTPEDRPVYWSHIAPLMNAAEHLSATANALDFVAELDKDIHTELLE